MFDLQSNLKKEFKFQEYAASQANNTESYNSSSEYLKIVTTEEYYGTSTLHIKLNLERATLNEVTQFNDYLKTELNCDYAKIILDLSETSFIDSTFLGAIIKLFKHCTSKGHNLLIVLDSSKIKILTSIEQIQKILPVYANLSDALNN